MSAPKAPTPAPTIGNVQLARTRSAPVTGAEGTSGSRVRKARPVLRSVLRPLIEAPVVIPVPLLAPRLKGGYFSSLMAAADRGILLQKMTRFASLADLHAACLDLPCGNAEAAAQVG